MTALQKETTTEDTAMFNHRVLHFIFWVGLRRADNRAFPLPSETIAYLRRITRRQVEGRRNEYTDYLMCYAVHQQDRLMDVNQIIERTEDLPIAQFLNQWEGRVCYFDQYLQGG
ncbi:unnamed protein product [Spodoptera exigua]|nr:unnamed protein product [Spodoptera exigua]